MSELQSHATRESIGEAVTTYDTAIRIQSPRPDVHSPWRPPNPRRYYKTYSRTRSKPYPVQDSNNTSESHSLLQEPQNVHGYSSATHFPYEEPVEEEREKGKLPPWVGTPQSLERSRKEWWKGIVGDAITMIVATPYLLVVGEAIRADGKPAIPMYVEFLEQITKIVATLFPLVFSAMVGRAMIKFATWKLERGAKLGLLERLIGSRTVLGTIKTQVRLGNWRLLSFGLVLLWLLSPFGSQAAQRIFSTTLISISSPANMTYINTRQPSYAGDPLFQKSWFAGFASLFSASLLAPEAVKTGPVDLWGNVKIPLFSSLPNLSEDNNGWRTIPQHNFTPSYSSLFGIPTSEIPPGNSTFNLESTYLELTCSNMTSSVTRTSTSFINPGLISTNGPFRSGVNVTDSTLWAVGYSGDDMSSYLLPSQGSVPNQCLGCIQNNFTSQKQVPGMLVYQDFEGSYNVTSIFCVPSQAYVESAIACNKSSTTQSCMVVSQRLSVLPNTPSAITLLSFSSVFTGLSQLLPESTQQSRGVDIMQNYIVAPLSNNFIQSAQIPRVEANMSSYSSTSGATSRLLNLSLQDFSIRLSQMLNTFLQGSSFNSTSFLTRSDISSSNIDSPLSTSSIPATTPSELSSEIQRNPLAITVPGARVILMRIFVCQYPWAAVLLVAALTMLSASISAVILRRRTLTRDYLPYVSSLVHESRFVTMPRGGVRMDGLERAKQMRDLKVRMADVGDVELGWKIGTGVAVNVGQLAVSDWDGIQREGGAVSKEKLYL